MIRRQILLYGILVSCVLGQVIVGNAEPPKQFGSFDQLTLTLDIPKDQVFPLEPLVFQVSLDNKTAKPIMGAPCLRPLCGGYFKLYVAKPGESIQLVDPLSWDSAGIITNYGPIAPGAHFQDRWTYDVGLDDYFYEPGVYHLKVVIPGKEGEKDLESSLAVLHVVEPGGVDKLAFEYVRDKHPSQPSRFWFGTGREELILLFPSTTYGLHAAYRQGQRARRNNDWAKATELITPAAEHPDFPLADEALDTLIIYYKRYHPEKARKYQHMLNQRFPHSQYAEKD